MAVPYLRSEIAGIVFSQWIPVAFGMALCFITNTHVPGVAFLYLELGLCSCAGLLYAHSGSRALHSTWKALLQIFFGILAWLRVLYDYGLI